MWLAKSNVRFSASWERANYETLLEEHENMTSISRYNIHNFKAQLGRCASRRWRGNRHIGVASDWRDPNASPLNGPRRRLVDPRRLKRGGWTHNKCLTIALHRDPCAVRLHEGGSVSTLQKDPESQAATPPCRPLRAAASDMFSRDDRMLRPSLVRY